MGTLLQVLEIIFEVKRRKSNEKITRRRINFPIIKYARDNNMCTLVKFI
jgi:hypothetical protein